MTQRDDLAVFRAEGGQGLRERGAQLGPAGSDIRVAAASGEIAPVLHKGVQRDLAVSTTLAEVVQAEVPEDPMEPRVEFSARAEPRHGPVGPRESLLRKIHRIVAIAHEGIGDAVGASLVRAHEDLERTRVARLSRRGNRCQIQGRGVHSAAPYYPRPAGLFDAGAREALGEKGREARRPSCLR